MAIGNLFDNRKAPKRGSGFQYQWKGDISFRSEDIQYLVNQLKAGEQEPKLFMSGESKEGKSGHYVTIMMREPKEQGNSGGGQAPRQQAQSEPVAKVEQEDVGVDDIPFA